MQKVVRKEVLKLLDHALIFPISDSTWVTPTQVISKKGSMKVHHDENNELIATRLITGWRMCIDDRAVNAANHNDHFPLPFIDQMVDTCRLSFFIVFLMVI